MLARRKAEKAQLGYIVLLKLMTIRSLKVTASTIAIRENRAATITTNLSRLTGDMQRFA